MDKGELMIAVERLTGRSRTKRSRTTFLCPGILDLSETSVKKSAIRSLGDHKYEIDKCKCSKCYLCKLKSKYVALDTDHFPYITEKEDNNTYEINCDDQIHFESNLATYDEESGISKWVYTIFRLFDIKKTFTECAISKELVPKKILEELGRYSDNDVYRKSVIPDIEADCDGFVFVFENKKYSSGEDSWILEGLKQIVIYAHSKIYREMTKKVIFVFCYNGSYDINDRIIEIIQRDDKLQCFHKAPIKDNYKFVTLPTSILFNIIKKSLKENKKDKNWIISAINSRPDCIKGRI